MQVAARVRPTAAPTWQTLILAGLLVTAGSIHLVLTPEHFEEGAHFGAFFLGTALFQFGLTYALLLRPGPGVYRTALWASALIVATWMVTRLVPPPGGPAPEPIELWGVVATAAEVAAIVGIATLTPSPGPRPSLAKRRELSLGGGVGFAALVLLSSGVVTLIQPGSWQGPSYLFRIYPLPSWRPTGVWLVVAGRWSILIPWLIVGFCILGGALVAWIVSMALRLPDAERCSARRRGVMAATPAALTVPVCCGAPLVAFAGDAAVGTLFQLTPWLMAASLVLLAADAVRLRLRLGGGPDA
ncbi:MAG: hypothetical protein ACRDJ9_31935 [Dehalococcoidia bacterium]